MKRNRDIISFFRDVQTVKPKTVEAETTQTQGGGTEASINENELALVVASSIPSVNAPSQSQPQSQSEAQATGNDSDELCYDVELLPHDPSKRIPIMRYAINDQDAVRRGFILKGPCQPRQHDMRSDERFKSLKNLVSGLSGNRETAQSQVLIGMGLLAGSTVFLLTLLWGTCVVVGKCDIGRNGVAIDSQDNKGFSLTGTGISTDVQTSYAARIMGISVLPFVIAQFPKMLKTHHGQRLAVLLALIVSFLLVLSYCLYQVFQPWIQRRKLAYAKHKHVISGILRHAQMEALGRLLDDNGTPNEEVIRKLFHKIDMDQSNTLSRAELHALIVGINFEEIDFDKDDAVGKIMDDFDTSGNEIVEEAEFVEGMKKWLNEAKRSVPASGAFSNKFINDYHARTRQEHDLLVDRSDEAVESVENPGWCIAKAVGLLLLGTAIVAAFADPLVDAVHNFSNATHIPSFFISFIALPLATNSSEAVSAVIFASRKKQRTCSLTFSEVYGGVTMNNTLCLGVFLALIYIRNLTWDFSSEVLIILLVCVIMALFTSFRTTFPLWTCLVAYMLYPLSLVVVYILDFIFGWS